MGKIAAWLGQPVTTTKSGCVYARGEHKIQHVIGNINTKPSHTVRIIYSRQTHYPKPSDLFFASAWATYRMWWFRAAPRKGEALIPLFLCISF